MGWGRESIVSSLSGRAVLDQSRSSRVRKAAEVRRGPRSVTGTMTERRSGEGGARRVRVGAQNGNFGAPVSRALRRFVPPSGSTPADNSVLITLPGNGVIMLPGLQSLAFSLPLVLAPKWYASFSTNHARISCGCSL